jgi:hypothetical protein
VDLKLSGKMLVDVGLVWDEDTGKKVGGGMTTGEAEGDSGDGCCVEVLEVSWDVELSIDDNTGRE